ncbi:glycoside hydrolase family 18 protein [Microbispora amethystogenes]|uniref:chitinase n=1 Tax=Microbispora amethystogenes TaxID=1427754 RepID=A0ABQ4FL23_9ACTN|nr:hypothetical protein Mam01_56830 [Microbispora amethystogenes]
MKQEATEVPHNTARTESPALKPGSASIGRPLGPPDWQRPVPARKIVVGVPAYGQGWTGVTSRGDGRYAPAAGPAPGTWAAGSDDYKNLVGKPGKRHRDLLTGALWLYDGNEFWSYDDPAVMLQKAAYIRLKGLGGSMPWSIDQDDAKASLTTALYSVLR